VHPAGALCLCSQCHEHDSEKLLVKAGWIEDNLAGGKLLYVTAGVVMRADTVLICQRANNQLWEFPGGKLDDGEDLCSCLSREMREELNLEVNILRPVGLVDHDYGRVKIRLFGLQCDSKNLNDLRLREHIDSRWCRVSDLPRVDFSAADVELARRVEKPVES
jgi:8-oxo-dGTP diphosphatase